MTVTHEQAQGEPARGEIVPVRVVDAHLHLWDPELLSYSWLNGRLNRRLGAAELAADIATAPPADYGFVFVQADCLPEQSVAEVDWAASQLPLRGIVARAPLEDPAATDRLLAEYAARPLVVGVRRMLQGAPDEFSATPEFRDAARAVASAGLVFDACVRGAQLPAVTALADAVPDLAIVLDHLGKPEVGSVDAASPAAGSVWAAALGDLAERPNVTCKLSGLPAEVAGEWSAAQLWPFLDVALSAFGPERLLFGGDWPVSGPYGRWVDTVSGWAHDRLGAVDAVMSGNAERVYRLR